MELDCLVLRRGGGTLLRGVCVPCSFGLVLACRSLADGDGHDALPEQALHMAADTEQWNTLTLTFLTNQYLRPSSASLWVQIPFYGALAH
jgi:hypothetical protein